jgi:hypothetical protein
LTTNGSQNATLTISGTPGGSVPVPLSGNATPALAFTPTTYAFPNAGVGLPSAAVSFTLKNSSASSVGPLKVALAGTDSTAFVLALKPSCNNATLMPGASCIADVSFEPTGAVGPMTATLTANAGANTAAQPVTLSGTAAATYTVSVALDKVNTTLWAGSATVTDQTSDLTFTAPGTQTFTKTYFTGSTYDVSIGTVAIPQIEDAVCMIFNPPYSASNPPPGAGNFCSTLADYQAATATFGAANVTLDLYCRSQEVCF